MVAKGYIYSYRLKEWLAQWNRCWTGHTIISGIHRYNVAKKQKGLSKFRIDGLHLRPMKFDRLLISRFSLLAIVAFSFFSFTLHSDVTRSLAKEKHLAQLNENIKSQDFVTLLTSIEVMNEVSPVYTNFSFFPFESSYSNNLRVQLAQIDTKKDSFRSDLKIYLHYQHILI